MSSRFLRNLIGVSGITTSLFIFQACYGTPQDMEPDILVEGKVSSSVTGEVIKDIKISFQDESQYLYSDSDGYFQLYVPIYADTIKLSFSDTAANGLYANKDTLITEFAETLFLDIKLDWK